MKDVIASIALMLVGSILLLAGCKPEQPQSEQTTNNYVIHYPLTHNISTHSKYVIDIAVFKVDGCEYIGAFGPNRASIVHKANCRNH